MRRRPGGSHGCRWRSPGVRWPPPPWPTGGSPRGTTAERTCQRPGRYAPRRPFRQRRQCAHGAARPPALRGRLRLPCWDLIRRRPRTRRRDAILGGVPPPRRAHGSPSPRRDDQPSLRPRRRRRCPESDPGLSAHLYVSFGAESLQVDAVAEKHQLAVRHAEASQYLKILGVLDQLGTRAHRGRTFEGCTPRLSVTPCPPDWHRDHARCSPPPVPRPHGPPPVRRRLVWGYGCGRCRA